MSSNNNPLIAYGFSQPLIKVFPPPIIVTRAPTLNDKAPFGTIWINPDSNNTYILTSITNNQANWEELGNAAVGITILTADSGPGAHPTGGAVDIAGGSNINTAAAASAVIISLNNNVTISGNFSTTGGNIGLPNTDSGGTEGVINFGGVPFISNYGISNTFLGADSGNSSSTGNGLNVGIGHAALSLLSDGSSNTIVGTISGIAISSGMANCGFGTGSLGSLTTGSYNTCIGTDSGSNYTIGSESSNICIGNMGTTSQSNVINIGTQGTGNGQQDTCYIAGIIGNTVSNTQLVTINSTTGQLGVTSVSPSEFTWHVVSTTTTLVAGNGYIVSGATQVSFILPITASVGDTFKILVLNTGTSGWTLGQNAGQYIILNSDNSGSSATVTTTGTGGSISTGTTVFVPATLVCAIANTAFIVSVGVNPLIFV